MFDFIVVGAGTAGCTLAARLTENRSANVLLIEAGPSGPRSISAPAAFPNLLDSGLNWGDSTAAQPELNGRKLAWWRGKVLGGSGSLGALIHLRSCRADYDGWGIPDWGFDDLTPDWVDLPANLDAPQPNPLTEVFLKACAGRGIPAPLEEPGHEGAGLYPVARVKGERWDARSAFLGPALKRGNLTVWVGVQAARVVIENSRATGVEYLLKGKRQQVLASKEVILCAGATGSAQMLLLSGIGPARQLETLGIAVASDVKGVGQNLQDHPAVRLRWTSKRPVSLDGTGTWGERLRYRWRREGPLRSNLIEAGAYLKSGKDVAACDLEVLFAPLYSLERGVQPPAEQHGFTLLAALLTPQSRGSIKLASADPLHKPVVDPGFLKEAGDRKCLGKAVERAREIAADGAFNDFRGAAVEDQMEELVVSLNHAAGTCRMGPDADSVVDAELRVKGVEGLRVADASVMPSIPRAHPNATVMAIARKAARLILA